MEIIMFKKEQMLILNYDDISIYVLGKYFLENPFRTIYIVKNDILFGIITLGDFSRYIKNVSNELIKTKFTFFNENQVQNAFEIINKGEGKINSIPIIGSDKKILFEYYKQNPVIDKLEEELEKKIFRKKNLLNLITIFKLYSIKNIIYIKELDFSRKICDKIFDVLNVKDFDITCMNYKSLVINKKNINWKNTIIIDLDCILGRHNYRELFLSENKIQYLNYKTIEYIITEDFTGDFKNNYTYIISMLGQLYGDILIIGDNNISNKMYDILNSREGKNISKCDKNDLCWNNEERCYNFINNCKTPDIVVSFDFSIHQEFIKFGNQKVLHFSLQSILLPSLAFGNPWDFDIVYNIIPKLLKGGVLPLILDSPDNEIDKLKNKERLYNLQDPYISSNHIDINNLDQETKEQFIKFNQYGDCEILQEVYNIPLTTRKGYPERENYRGKYINIFDGVRHTVGSLKNKDKSKIFLLGPCIIFGTFVKDEDTIASNLQKELDGKYSIINMGHHYLWNNFKIRSCEYRSGDIIIIMVDDKTIYKQQSILVHSIIEVYNKVPNLVENIWDQLRHCNRVISSYVAQELYSILKNFQYFKNDNQISQKECVKFGNQIEISRIEYPQLDVWLNGIEKIKFADGKKIGSIVMNCNPFTNGHRFLIEETRKQVDYLYIFVVEENKSFFKFEDRIELVKQGTADLSNIIVYPSGSFIISSATLPGYFDKDNLQDVQLDASDDLQIFSQKIAPTLNISIRFAGEEPLDKFTCQYNEAMESILPKYGIQFVEIKRKYLDGEPISASRVRKKLLEKDFESIKKMVPKTTYNYIVEHF